MSYVNAKEIFPEELLVEIRKYFRNGLLYIPLSEEEQREREENMRSLMALEERNLEIKQKKKAGYRIEELMEEYHLSYDSIKRIVYRRT